MKNKVQLITYVDRFGGKGISELHHFLTTKLSGVFDGGVHLLPFYYPIDGADAGYDPIDHTEVDSRLGSWEDAKHMAKDYDIMGDIIVNHISAQSKEFKDVELNGSKSSFYDLFLTKERIFPKGASEADIQKIYRPRPSSPFTPKKLITGEEINLWTTFTSNQLDIDVFHPLGETYLNAILGKFGSADIKMIRLDAAGYAVKKAGTSCFMLPQTYEFIDDFTQNAQKLGMEVLVEIHSHYEQQINIAKKVDYVYDFALPPLVLHSIRTKRSTELKKWLAISPRNCITVLDTHDGIGVIDVAKGDGRPGLLSDEDVDTLVESIHENSLGKSRQATGAAASNLDLYQVNCTFYEALGKSDSDYLISRAIQFFCPGVPQVYYMGLLAGENDMELLEKTKVGRDINRHYYSFEEVAQQMERLVVQDLISLIRFRNEHPSFEGELELVDAPDHELRLKRTNGDHWSLLKVDLEKGTLHIDYSNPDGISLDFQTARTN